MKEVDTCKGKVINSISLENNELMITFADDTHLAIADGGQCCCEHRYMSSDDLDRADHYKGIVFVGVEVKDGPDQGNDEHDVHNTQFLIVKTFLGDLTFVNHNEHNGYYGGFSLDARTNAPLPTDEEPDGH